MAQIEKKPLTSWTHLKYNSYMTIIESLYTCTLKMPHTNTAWGKKHKRRKASNGHMRQLISFTVNRKVLSVLEKVGQSYNVFIDNASSSSSNINQWGEKKHSLVWQACNPNHWEKKPWRLYFSAEKPREYQTSFPIWNMKLKLRYLLICFMEVKENATK